MKMHPITISVLWGDDEFTPKSATRFRRYADSVDYILKQEYDDAIRELNELKYAVAAFKRALGEDE